GSPISQAAGSSDVQYEAIAKAFFYDGFAASPVTATNVGVHTYDAQLDDVSATAVATQVTQDHRTLTQLQAIDPSTLSTGVALDYGMLVNRIKDDLLLTETLQQWKHNPDIYTSTASDAVYGLIERAFAPLPTRMRAAIAREQQFPRLFKEARVNLSTVDAATKDIAYEEAAGSIDFFAHDVPQAFASVHDPSLQSRLRASTAVAVKSLTSYAAFIKTIAPKGTFAIGSDAYEKRLQYEDWLNMPVDQYVQVGENALAATRAQFVATAKIIDASKTPEQVYASLATDHPPAGQLVSTASGDLTNLRAFLISNHIITLPAEANIKVVETPPFQRAFITAQMDPPGALETVATQAYYNVTPVDPSWSRARQDGYLAQFNNYQRPIISAHEVYPGHFVNFTIDRQLNLSLTRKLLWNVEFGEGWAHYGEQMVVDEGWGNGDPRVRLAQLEEALLRECRYVVGVNLHTKGWSLTQAENLFTTQCFQTPAVALEETMRGTQDPMYGYYTLGKMMILKLRADYEKKLGGAYTIEKFHDALLSHGDPPLPLLRPILLGSADDGKPL
ncbi:MAG: DUF885 domain-containing protein, partial [Candidatus Tumulicola sp.]